MSFSELRSIWNIISDDLHSYWMILAAAVILSFGWFLFNAGRRGYSLPRSAAGFLLGIPLAFFCAKAMYIVLHIPEMQEFGAEAWIRLKPKEFSFVAGCAGFCLGPVLLFLSRRKDIPGVMDQLIVPGCILAAAVRFAEIYLAKAPETLSDIGLMSDYYITKKTDPSAFAFFDRFPLSVPKGKKILMISVSTPAALLILLIAVYILILWFRSGKKENGISRGMVFEHGVFLLCALRLFLEVFTTKTKFYFVHVDQVLCALIIIALMVRIGIRLKKAGRRFPVLAHIAMVILIAVNAGAQFFLDGKLNKLFSESTLQWLTEGDHMKNTGYIILLATSVALAVIYGCLCLKLARARRDTE